MKLQIELYITNIIGIFGIIIVMMMMIPNKPIIINYLWTDHINVLSALICLVVLYTVVPYTLLLRKMIVEILVVGLISVIGQATSGELGVLV